MALDAPTAKEFKFEPEFFKAMVYRRLGWPLPLAPAKCEGCGGRLDVRGDHRNSCMKSGRVQLRAKFVERAVAQISW